MSSRSSRLACTFACALVAAVVAAPGPARAESAKESYSRGLSLYAAGHYEEAADAFVAAYERKHKPLILFNIGQAYRKKGDLDQAVVYYRRFLAEASPEERAPMEEETRKYVKEIEAEQALKRTLIDKADAEEASKLDFQKGGAATTTQPLAGGSETTTPATTLTTTTTQTAPPREHTPIYKTWWLWSAVGVAAAGLAIGLGVGLGSSHNNDPATALGTRMATF